MKKENKQKYNADQHLMESIRKGDEQAFKRLFFNYYYELCGFASQLTQSREQAKDIVQEVFYKLWKQRRRWTIYNSLKAYLFQSVRNEALNQIDKAQHQLDVREAFATEGEERSDEPAAYSNKENEELLTQIWEIVSVMPQRRRSVFVLHRKHGLSYKEIANILEISRKTVENHMGLALNDIRKQIREEPN